MTTTSEPHNGHVYHCPRNYTLHDARKIYVGRYCAKPGCLAALKARYNPEIFTNPNYNTEEAIDA